MTELINLWFGMAFLLNEEGVDPSYYSVFRELLMQWHDRSESSNLEGFRKLVILVISKIAGATTLSTGRSVCLLWAASRPLVPSNLEMWNIYSRLIDFVDEFDKRVNLKIG